jgi:hypothetical protein
LSSPPWGRIFLVFRSKNGPQAGRLQGDLQRSDELLAQNWRLKKPVFQGTQNTLLLA